MKEEIPIEAIDIETNKSLAKFPSIKKANYILLIPISVISRTLKKQDKYKEFYPLFSRRLNKQIYIQKL